MTVILSTGLREGLATTGSLRSLINNTKFHIYSGIVPALADDSIGNAVLLCEVSNSGAGITFEDAAPGGILLKKANETWTGTNLASGAASFFRLVQSSDTGSSSTTAVRIQGTVGILGSDMELVSVNLAEGAPQVIDVAAFTIPATA